MSSSTTKSDTPIHCRLATNRAVRWLRWLAARSTVGVVAAWLLTLVGFAGDLHWMADAMNHLRWHMLWACLLAVFLLSVVRWYRWLAVAALCFVVNGLVVWPGVDFVRAPTSGRIGQPVKLMFWNINAGIRDMTDVCQTVDQQRKQLIVGGDFNITPWAEEFRSLLRTSGMRDSRVGFGYQATWPSKLGVLGIPIDQVLVSPQVRVLDRQVLAGKNVSDHAAVFVTVAMISP